MDCFDRVGERTRLLNSIRGGANFCFVAGRSGVGKSHIINSVLSNELGMAHVLKYEIGRNPLLLTQFLFACAMEQQPLRSKILQSIKSIRLNELNLSIPFVGKAPIKWDSQKLDIDRAKLPFVDIIREIEGPLYANERREILKISNLLMSTDFKAVWISNIEEITNNGFGLILLIVKLISPRCLVILEGAYSGQTYKLITEQLRLLSDKNNLVLSLHNVKPFNEHYAKGLFDYLGLADKGIAFSYKHNLGLPAAIKFDLAESSEISGVGKKLEECFSDGEDAINTLLLLTLFYSIENRYQRIITLAEHFNIRLSIRKALETGIVSLTSNLCELSHPKIARYLTLLKKQDIFRFIDNYYKTLKSDSLIEVDLAAIAYSDMLDNKTKIKLFDKGINYILKQLEANKLNISDHVLTFIETGIESLTTDQVKDKEVDVLYRKASLIRLQIDSMLCRLTGVSTNRNRESLIELLLFAQVRMRMIDLHGAIALSEAVKANLNIVTLSDELSDWFDFCATYIQLSSLIALGEFSRYSDEYLKLQSKINNSRTSTKCKVLISLLPVHGNMKKHSYEYFKLEDPFLAARYKNNLACELMTKNINNPEIPTMLSSSIEAVSLEGSVEMTFPINNYGLYSIYSGNADEAIDLYFSMIDQCTYPYDYFSAYHNLAIAMATKGSIEQALEFSNQSHKYVLDGSLKDPVFAIKSYFNHALLSYINGDETAWKNFLLINFDFNTLPIRYADLLNKKIQYVEKNTINKELVTCFSNDNIELSNALWPQNLQFWDFMYPIISLENIDEITNRGGYCPFGLIQET
ncbi:hypothetical protein DXX93_10135 [Thalassotalea euphylliae]|uniref:Uncharacterized protein n=1 Tax=Thalassotalea euphylliae TaxID=1655234 RepID=A0A3E0TSD5_9GAMM|nr:hypothetical protein [Thalassotalea euphylliae]REL26892.1 hypothetical protein DXX93_10135 [Thalassotalea euphylliae]